MACRVCGGTTIARKGGVVVDWGHKIGRWAVVRSGMPRLPMTLDVCVSCGRLDFFLEDPQQWLNEHPPDHVFQTDETEE